MIPRKRTRIDIDFLAERLQKSSKDHGGGSWPVPAQAIYSVCVAHETADMPKGQAGVEGPGKRGRGPPREAIQGVTDGHDHPQVVFPRRRPRPGLEAGRVLSDLAPGTPQTGKGGPKGQKGMPGRSR
jgi:hypothetical protein